jgi:hypothetical protein
MVKFPCLDRNRVPREYVAGVPTSELLRSVHGASAANELVIGMVPRPAVFQQTTAGALLK